ncbi:Hypothetical protein AT6N2_L1942 [Agrobacterium tumefaciens]|nr:Hypothetical protein AT6N2_L1942 [Agrobacterium tumefaciens]
MIIHLFSIQNAVRIQRRNRNICPRRNIAGKLKREITPAADPQERGEIAEIVPGIDRFIVKLGDELHAVHAIAARDLVQRRPEEVLKPHTGHHAVDPERPRMAFPKRGVCLDEKFAHGFLPHHASKDRRKTGLAKAPFHRSHLASTAMNCDSQAGWAGHAGAVTSFPSVTPHRSQYPRRCRLPVPPPGDRRDRRNRCGPSGRRPLPAIARRGRRPQQACRPRRNVSPQPALPH